jgi:hypothetical protein
VAVQAKSENDGVQSETGRTFYPIAQAFYLIVLTLNPIVLAQSETGRAFYPIGLTFNLIFLTFTLIGRTSSATDEGKSETVAGQSGKVGVKTETDAASSAMVSGSAARCAARLCLADQACFQSW